MKVLIILLALVVAAATWPSCDHDVTKDCICVNDEPCMEDEICFRGKGDHSAECVKEKNM
uniref:Decorsin variant 5 n=1 Tax=Macrobdella decora TaxID=6405 RepID=A0A482JSM6_MACDE|nr:decorsin variant 5 [Macrobdella decora]